MRPTAVSHAVKGQLVDGSTSIVCSRRRWCSACSGASITATSCAVRRLPVSRSAAVIRSSTSRARLPRRHYGGFSGSRFTAFAIDLTRTSGGP